MTKPNRKTQTDLIRLKSFVYWTSKALAELESMTPETRQAMDGAIREINIPEIKDLASLEKAYSLLSLKAYDKKIQPTR